MLTWCGSLVRAATVYSQLAEVFGISEASIYNWVMQADLDDDGVRPGLAQQEADELREDATRSSRKRT